ncbi:SAICAR synthase-like protein [Trametes sanguinea]|nr:SAICAR synthase-like protein [Trametes sanguinea]
MELDEGHVYGVGLGIEVGEEDGEQPEDLASRELVVADEEAGAISRRMSSASWGWSTLRAGMLRHSAMGSESTPLVVPVSLSRCSPAVAAVSHDDQQVRQSHVSSSPTSYLFVQHLCLVSRPSSTHTVTGFSSRDAELVNPIHSLAFPARKQSPAQEVHILKVTDDVVKLEQGPMPEPLIHKVGASLAHAVPPYHQHRQGSADSNVGPPPPSPPSSVENEDALAPPRKPATSTSQTDSPSHRPITVEEPRKHRSSLRFSSTSVALAPSTSSHGLRHRSSADTRSSLQTSQSAYPSSSLETPLTGEPSAHGTPSVSKSLPPRAGSHMSVDGYLHLPHPHKPSRRNTIGSSALAPHQSPPRPTRMATIQGHPSTLEEPGEFADDIEQQVEQIRRERMFDDKRLVGNLIGEDRVMYVLMYNMLTGIRIAVSRCQAKIRRPLTDEDYPALHTYSFHNVGNELTPSAKYDFKFKDYAPWVFRELREDYCSLDSADYLLSLTAKYILSEFGSPANHHHNEHKFLRRILKQYYEHVKSNSHILLSRLYWLHRVKLPHGRKIHFVIMNNVFPAHKDIHGTYDLKGSNIGRGYLEERAAQNPRVVLKGLNWIKRKKTLELGPESARCSRSSSGETRKC